jgi:hypothetical protein
MRQQQQRQAVGSARDRDAEAVRHAAGELLEIAPEARDGFRGDHRAQLQRAALRAAGSRSRRKARMSG